MKERPTHRESSAESAEYRLTHMRKLQGTRTKEQQKETGGAIPRAHNGYKQLMFPLASGKPHCKWGIERSTQKVATSVVEQNYP